MNKSKTFLIKLSLILFITFFGVNFAEAKTESLNLTGVVSNINSTNHTFVLTTKDDVKYIISTEEMLKKEKKEEARFLRINELKKNRNLKMKNPKIANVIKNPKLKKGEILSSGLTENMKVSVSVEKTKNGLFAYSIAEPLKKKK